MFTARMKVTVCKALPVGTVTLIHMEEGAYFAEIPGGGEVPVSADDFEPLSMERWQDNSCRRFFSLHQMHLVADNSESCLPAHTTYHGHTDRWVSPAGKERLKKD